jgi:hypothetical protein
MCQVGYAAPEVISRRFYSSAADVFAAGAVLYVMLVGYPPFLVPNDERATLQRTVTGQYRWIAADWRRVTPEAIDLVRRCLANRVEDRITIPEILRHSWLRRGISGVGGNSSTAARSSASCVGSLGASGSLRAVGVGSLRGPGAACLPPVTATAAEGGTSCNGADAVVISCGAPVAEGNMDEPFLPAMLPSGVGCSGAGGLIAESVEPSSVLAASLDRAQILPSGSAGGGDVAGKGSDGGSDGETDEEGDLVEALSRLQAYNEARKSTRTILVANGSKLSDLMTAYNQLSTGAAITAESAEGPIAGDDVAADEYNYPAGGPAFGAGASSNGSGGLGQLRLYGSSPIIRAGMPLGASPSTAGGGFHTMLSASPRVVATGGLGMLSTSLPREPLGGWKEVQEEDEDDEDGAGSAESGEHSSDNVAELKEQGIVEGDDEDEGDYGI